MFVDKQIILEVFSMQITINSQLSQTGLICNSDTKEGFLEKYCKRMKPELGRYIRESFKWADISAPQKLIPRKVWFPGKKG